MPSGEIPVDFGCIHITCMRPVHHDHPETLSNDKWRLHRPSVCALANRVINNHIAQRPAMSPDPDHKQIVTKITAHAETITADVCTGASSQFPCTCSSRHVTNPHSDGSLEPPRPSAQACSRGIIQISFVTRDSRLAPSVFVCVTLWLSVRVSGFPLFASYLAIVFLERLVQFMVAR